MTKPRGKTPSLLSKTNGKPCDETAKRTRKCCRCEGSIKKGSVFFIVPSTKAGFPYDKSFCLECFGNTLSQTEGELKELRDTLEKHRS